MNRFNRTFAILLAGGLQVMPLLRNVIFTPSASSSFAIIFRWAIGSTAALGTVDAVSGSTSLFTSPSTFNGSVGTYFSNNVVVSIGGGNTAASNDYFFLSSGTVTSPVLGNGQSTTVTLPPGLIFKASWVNGQNTIGGILYGTPTTAGTSSTTVTCVSPGNASLSQKITFTISGSTTPTPPSITTQPSGTNVLAGKTATFSVTTGGTTPLGYFWWKDNASLADGGNLSGTATATLTVANASAADAGNYFVVVSNSVGSVTSSIAPLAIIVPPTITSQPADQSLQAGAGAQFSVAAAGSSPLSYRWLKNGATLANGSKYSGATSNVLTVASITTADAGNYSAIITNLAGSVTSSNAALAIVSSPTILTPPASQSIAVGANASFTVNAAGSTPLFYQWLKNTTLLVDGGNVSGTTTATLSLTGAGTNDAGNYSVVVSNSLGSITSPAATLTVSIPPSIVIPPADVTVTAGSNVNFTVTASGTAPLTYQWLKNGISLVNGGNISGATSPALALANVSVTDAANYSVSVSNSVGGIISGTATLTVLGPPAFTSQPANATIAQGNKVSFTVAAGGTAPLSFQWFKNNSPLTDGGTVSGSGSNILTLVGVTTNDAASYYVVVTNIVGNTTSSSATLTVIVPPVIATQPVDASILAGSNVVFTVSASGTGPMAYQWRRNGSILSNGGNLSGATSATLTIAGVSASDAGNYSVTASNLAGVATSSAAVLTVLSPPAIVAEPVNQITSLGSTITLAVTASGTDPLTYQWFKDGTALEDGGNLSGAISNTLDITTLTTNDLGSYFVLVSNAFGSATSTTASVSLNNNSPPLITVQPSSQIAAKGSTVVLKVTANGAAPLFYQWLKNGKKIASSTTISGVYGDTLTLLNVATNNNGNYSVIVTNLYGTAVSSNASLAIYSLPQIKTTPASRLAVVGSNVTFSVTVGGTSPFYYQWLRNGNPLSNGGRMSGASTSTLKITGLTTNDSGNYSVFVSNLLGQANSGEASLKVVIPPAFTLQPVSQSVVAGNGITFTADASGTSPMHFQWRKAGLSIKGATNASFTISSTKPSDSAGYSVVVTNFAGRIVSTNAFLTVFVSPNFVSQAKSRFAKAGSITIFQATVTGTKPLAFQWFKDGVALTNDGRISGTLTNVLKITNLTTNDTGAYSLTVSNLAGEMSSSDATLTVVVPPVFTLQPVAQSIVVGDSVTFAAAASGTSPMHFQWRKAGLPIKGETNASLTIAATKLSDTAGYSVVVTNFAGRIVSTNTRLTIFASPTFVSQARSRAAKLGSTAIFNATVTGTKPLSFQWFKDGIALTNGGRFSGVFTNALKITTLTTDDEGAYSLTVSNFAGEISSSNAMLTVIVPPAIVQSPISQPVVAGDSVTFTVVASGTAPLHYQWRKAGWPIKGANNSSFTIDSARASDASSYSVVITNLAGKVVSPGALLSVNTSDSVVANVAPTVPAAITPLTPPFISDMLKTGQGDITLHCTGRTNSVYILQASPDLVTWTDIATNTADGNSAWQATDHSQADRRFYRLKQGP